MPIRRENWLFSLMVFTNTILVAILLVKLRVAPSDVMKTVNEQSSRLTQRLDNMELEQRQIGSQLARRAEWMRQLTDLLRTLSGSVEFPDPPE